MKRMIRRSLAIMAFIPAVLLVTLVGCGGGDKDKKSAPAPGTTSKKDEGGKKEGTSVAAGGTLAPGKGKITGRVVLDGDMPKLASLEDEMKKHNDAKVCLMCDEAEKIDQTWVIGKDKAVANAVIWLAAPKGSKFDVVETKGNVEIDQPHCVYLPHVLVLKPGQKLKIKNSAPISHNTKWEGDPLINPAAGRTIPPGKFEDNVELKPEDAPISLRCDFHKWMEAKVWSLPHQYAAVTGADGTFTIDNVPDGVELSVVGWHEAGGYFNGGKKGTKLNVTAGENKLGDLKVSAK